MDKKKFARPVTAIVIGAGSRADIYGDFAFSNADKLNIIGVAEPNQIRNKRYSERHKIRDDKRFDVWQEVFEKEKFADAIILTTPDHLHYEPCIKALKLGYDILMEKPISPSEKECREILELAKKTNRIVGVCHVLRYAPYFQKLKDIIDTKLIGELISVQHMEPIEHAHMAHSYVRGIWHNSKNSTPIILGKSCHDLDILRWLIDSECTHISAYGNRKWFRNENAPKGSTDRCTDGCSVEAECPYSALKIYQRDKEHTYVFDFPEDESQQEDFLIEELKTTDYGKCVYKMNNDQPDHYVASMLFKNGVTANFSMEAFTSYHGRRTRLMGSMGDVVGDMDKFVHTDFRTGKRTEWFPEEELGDYHSHKHGGGDSRLVHDWVLAVSKQDKTLLSSTIEVSIESHVMCFSAEKSRTEKKTVQVEI